MLIVYTEQIQTGQLELVRGGCVLSESGQLHTLGATRSPSRGGEVGPSPGMLYLGS